MDYHSGIRNYYQDNKYKKRNKKLCVAKSIYNLFSTTIPHNFSQKYKNKGSAGKGEQNFAHDFFTEGLYLAMSQIYRQINYIHGQFTFLDIYLARFFRESLYVVSFQQPINLIVSPLT